MTRERSSFVWMNVFWCGYVAYMLICFMWIADIIWLISSRFNYFQPLISIRCVIARSVFSLLVIHLNYLKTHSHTRARQQLLTSYWYQHTLTQHITHQTSHIIIYEFTYGPFVIDDTTLCPHCHHRYLLIYCGIQVILIRYDITKWPTKRLCHCMCVRLRVYPFFRPVKVKTFELLVEFSINSG